MRHDKLNKSSQVNELNDTSGGIQWRSHELYKSSIYDDPSNTRHDELNKSSQSNELHDATRGIQWRSHELHESSEYDNLNDPSNMRNAEFNK